MITQSMDDQANPNWHNKACDLHLPALMGPARQDGKTCAHVEPNLVLVVNFVGDDPHWTPDRTKQGSMFMW
jgi:hypothetical protein